MVAAIRQQILVNLRSINSDHRWPAAARLAATALALVAWLVVSNHCFLGARIASALPAGGGCHSEHSQKEKSHSPLSCCQGLHAPASELAKSPVAPAALLGDALLASPLLAILLRAEAPQPPTGLDTGPPEPPSFAESILQRSLLAHAPPLV